MVAIGTTMKNKTQTTNCLKMTRTGSVILRNSRKWRTTWRRRSSVLLRTLLSLFQRGTYFLRTHTIYVNYLQFAIPRDEPGVVSPVKVVLTPVKDLSDEKGAAADEEDEEVTLVDDGEVKLSRKPLLWEVELLMTEQKEDYDEDQDPEYVPPPTCADISLDYDEVIQNAALQ